jgi:hypothetical protein
MMESNRSAKRWVSAKIEASVVAAVAAAAAVVGNRTSSQGAYDQPDHGDGAFRTVQPTASE